MNAIETDKLRIHRNSGGCGAFEVSCSYPVGGGLALLKLRNAKEKEAEHCDTCFPAGRIECTDRKEEKWAQTGNHGFRTAGRRGKKGRNGLPSVGT